MWIVLIYSANSVVAVMNNSSFFRIVVGYRFDFLEHEEHEWTVS